MLLAQRVVLVVTQSVLDIILVAPVTAVAVAEETQTGHFSQTVDEIGQCL